MSVTNMRPGIGQAGRALRSSWPLFLALTVGAVLRFELVQTTPPFLVANDSADYFAAGLTFLSTGQLELSLKRAPLYALQLPGLIGITGPSLDQIVAAQHLLGLLTIVLTYLLGRQAFGRLAGAVAAFGVSINGNLLIMEHLLISEVLSTPILLGSLAALLVAFRRPRLAWWLAAGLLLGLGALCRPLGIAVLGMALVALPASRLPRGVWVRGAGLLLLGAAVCLAPWFVRQQVVHEQAMVNGGLGDALFSRVHRYDPTFALRYDGLRPDGLGSSDRDREIGARIVELARQFEYPREVRAVLRTQFGIDDREADRQLRTVALSTILHDPGRYLIGTLGMAGRLARSASPNLPDLWISIQRDRVITGWPSELAWVLTTDRPINDPAAFSRTAAQLGAYRDDLPSGLVLLAFAPLGAAWALMNHRPAGWQAGHQVGAGLIPLVVVSQIVLYVALDGPLDRYRFPLQPLITLLGAAGLALAVGQLAAAWRVVAPQFFRLSLVAHAASIHRGVRRAIEKGSVQMWTRVAQSFLLTLMMAATPFASAQTGPTTVPDNLKVPRESVVLFKTLATGVQLYVCKARTDAPGTYEWMFKAPVAELWNEAGEKVGTHYAGPTWEGNDGSKVMGEVVERANAPDPNAIPWLLLKAKSNAGTGAFSTVTHVQRLETVGGIAPSDGCNQSTADTERAVEYQATYTFAYEAAQ